MLGPIIEHVKRCLTPISYPSIEQLAEKQNLDLDTIKNNVTASLSESGKVEAIILVRKLVNNASLPSAKKFVDTLKR